MKVNLRGLFKNAVDCTPIQRRYYHDCLAEVHEHLQQVVDGKATIQEFADLYCIKASPRERGSERKAPSSADA